MKIKFVRKKSYCRPPINFEKAFQRIFGTIGVISSTHHRARTKIIRELKTERGAVNIYGEQWIRSQTQKAQESLEHLSREKMYETLVDPLSRSTQERISFAKEATKQYIDIQVSNICKVFEDEFMCWTEGQFEVCQITSSATLVKPY